MPAFVWIALGVFVVCLLAGTDLGGRSTGCEPGGEPDPPIGGMTARLGIDEWAIDRARAAPGHARAEDLAAPTRRRAPPALGRPGARAPRRRPWRRERRIASHASSSVDSRRGAVDLGTNSTRLLVADVATAGRRGRTTARVHPSGRRRRCSPAAAPGLDRARTKLPHRLPPRAGELGAERTLAFGTSAVRDAENGEAFLGEIEWSYGFATRLLSGHDEALLTFRGVTAGRAIEETR